MEMHRVRKNDIGIKSLIHRDSLTRSVQQCADIKFM